MSKQKKKDLIKPKSKSFTIIIGIIIIAFLALLLSDLFKKKPNSKTAVNNKLKSENYKFTKDGELTFQSSKGEFISTIDMEFADNDHKRAQGLMYRTEMVENQGMLFIFPYEALQSFYMKNTIMSLDMIFVNSNLEIVTIHENTKPYTLENYASSKPAQYVIETIAGYVDKFNINVGDKVIFRRTN